MEAIGSRAKLFLTLSRKVVIVCGLCWRARTVVQFVRCCFSAGKVVALLAR